eukprot:1185472-Prorocentrum_minimum.AAC.3
MRPRAPFCSEQRYSGAVQSHCESVPEVMRLQATRFCGGCSGTVVQRCSTVTASLSGAVAQWYSHRESAPEVMRLPGRQATRFFGGCGGAAVQWCSGTVVQSLRVRT